MIGTRSRSLKVLFFATTGLAGSLAVHPAAVSAAEPDVETIVVTAQRRAEALPDVPITVTSLDATALLDAGVKSLADISNLTTGLRFDKKGAYTQATIRGVGSALGGIGVGSNIGIYVDGFYMPSLVTMDFDLMNIQDVQVLKGPQGTLFGRNTTAGAILVTTRKPSTTTRADVELSYASYNAQRARGYFTTGLTDKIAWDFAVDFNRGDGWYNNIFTNDDKVGKYERWTMRSGLNFDVTDNFSVLFRYERYYTDDPSSLMTNMWIDPTLGQPLGYASTLPGVVVATKRGEVPYSIDLALVSRGDAFRLAATWDLGFATLASYSQHQRGNTPTYLNDYAQSSAKITSLKLPVTNNSTTQELLLTSNPGGRLQYTIGAFYFESEEEFPGNQLSAGGAPYVVNGASHFLTRSLAAFADLTYEVMDNLFVSGGLRYTNDALLEVSNITGVGAPRVHHPDLKTDRFTPRAVVRYALNEDSNVYASFTQGFKAQIYNLALGTSIPVRPEKLTAYEVGYKYAIPGVSLNLSSFYYDYKDEQLTSYPFINGQPTSLITNAASSHLYGIDADTQFSVTDDLSVNASVSWLHARYRRFPSAPGFRILPNRMMQIEVVDGSGMTRMRSPALTATVGARYTTMVADGELALSGNLYYTSKFYFDPVEKLPQEAYATLALRAEWTDPTERYTLALYATNVTDTEYLYQIAQTSLVAAASWGPPRMIGGSVRVRF